MPDLPSGTVTFLFTDIEGSTALWERDQVAVASAVARHLTLLRATTEAHDGVLFKVVGDAVQAAFPTAPDAIAAAFEAQRALLVEDWGEIGPLKVRMAVHTGEAIPDARGDYLTAALNRLSRLLSTGYGSQILLSQTVQQLTRGVLPDGVGVRDLGEHRLRDLLEPERVFQLVHLDLPVQFPPLKSLESRPNNLPRQPTPFLGREREVAAVVELLGKDDVQLVTLVGPGGTGKTRLALQAAADLLDDFADGVFFVPLAPLTDPDLIPSTIATALGVHEEGGQPLGERLRDFLAAKQLLLVLDNFEHLAVATPAVAELLGISAGLKVLATSRMPLRLRAEREYPVSPLGLPRRKPPPPPEQLSQYEAVRLFIERAQAVKPDFAVNNENAPAIAEICHRLDGLPLAIELAAARIRILPPQALLTRLEQRLPFLTGGARDAPERQRTLRHTITWSYDLLSPEEQQLFRRLAVFAGGATFEAVEAVVNPDGSVDVFGSLERLVEQSLLRQDVGLGGEPRFSMLETIREFGLELLAANGEAEAVRRGHAVFFVELAAVAEPNLWGPNQRQWLERLETEHDNLRQTLGWSLEHATPDALRLAASLHRFWSYRGHFKEGRVWLDRTLATCGEPTPVRVKALHGAGRLADLQGDYRSAKPLQESSLALARTIDDREGEAKALLALSVLAESEGDSERAKRLAEESLAVSRRLGDPLRIATALGNLGYGAYGRGELERAEVLLDEGLKLAREVGDWLLVAVILDSQGAVSQARGNLAQAATSYREALRLVAEIGDQADVASYVSAIASVAVAGRQLEAATRLWGAAASITEMLDAPLPPEEQARHAQPMATARAELGDVAFAAAYDAGRVLPLDQAVAEALALAEELVNTANA